MEQLLGTTVLVFVFMTFVLFGIASFMTGLALANGWQPIWKVVPYGIMMAVGNRFLVFALYGGELLSVSGFVIASAVIVILTGVVHRAVQAHKMVSQYPWLYESSGLFNWRERRSGG